MRKRHAVFDAKLDAEEIRDPRENGVNRVEHRRHEQERELDRLGNPGQKRRQSGRDHEGAGLRSIFRPRALPDGNSGGWQPPHLEEVSARHVPGGWIAGGESMDLAANDRAGCGIEILPHLEEERHVPDVMETKRNQRTFYDTVEREGSGGISRRGPVRKLSLIHISEPTRLLSISYAVFC